MTTITTSTASTATAYSNQRKIDRCQNGVLWAWYFGGDNTTVIATGRYSTDNGATWTLADNVMNGSGTSNTSARNSSFFIDLDDYAHVVFKDNGNGYIYYRRGTPNAARTSWTWSAATTLDSSTTSDYPDIVAHRESTGWVAHVVISRTSSTVRVIYIPITITGGGVVTAGSSSVFSSPASVSVHAFPSIDFNHAGDGKTVAGGTPHLYCAWSAGQTGAGYGIRFKKATYSGGSWTWGTEREIDSTRYIAFVTEDWLNCLFDGTRVVIAGQVYDAGNRDVVLHDRDAADTTTTTRTLNDNAAGTDRLISGSATYDSAGNVYLFGSDESGSSGARTLEYIKWTRGSAATARTTVETSAPNIPYVSAKRGYSDNRIEFIYTDGTASPYNVTYGGISLNAAPNAPTLTAPINSSVIDKDSSQQFTWTFNDPDTGDLQSAYELRYRVTGTSTWTVVSGGASQNHTFAAGTFGVGDYEWQVRTTDNAGVVGPWSGSSLFSAASTPAAPSIYDPANNGTVNSNPYLVKWTAPSQDAFQVRTVADSAGAPNTGTIYYESLVIDQPATRQFSTPFNTNNRVEHVQVRVRVGGLWSTWHSVLVNVSYTESQPGNLVATPEPEFGRIRVEFTPPVPGVGEPSITSNELHRKINGTVEYIALARDLGSTFTYFDYNASGGVAWEYQVLSFADNNTSVYSVPEVITPMQLTGSWIHVANDGLNTALQLIYNDNAGDEDYEIAKSLFQTAGTNEPFVEFGEHHDHSITVRLFVTSEEMPYFKILMRMGRILCYRDFYGRKIFCIPEASPIQRTRDGGYSTVKFREVAYEEAV